MRWIQGTSCATMRRRLIGIPPGACSKIIDLLADRRDGLISFIGREDSLGNYFRVQLPYFFPILERHDAVFLSSILHAESIIRTRLIGRFARGILKYGQFISPHDISDMRRGREDRDHQQSQDNTSNVPGCV